MNSNAACEPKTPRRVGFGHRARCAVVIVGAAILCFALRLYEDFAATGRIEMATRVAEALPSTHGIYHATSLALDMPLVLLNSCAVALFLARFFSRTLWKYAFAVGALSEVAWVLLWRAFVWGRSPSEWGSHWALSQSLCFVFGLPFAACYIERVFKTWRQSQST